MVMTRGRESHNHQQFSALNSTDFDHTILLQLDQNYGLSCFPMKSDDDLQCPDTAQQNPFDGLLERRLPCKNLSSPIENGFLKGSHCAAPRGLDVKDKPIDASNAPKRKFLIFDRSGNNTRLYFSHPISPQNETIASKASLVAKHQCEKIATGVDQQLLMDPLLEEKWDENHLTEEEGEMHEDTEELNALLYSDSDDEYFNYDEVTSMAHAPFDVEESSKKGELIEELSSCEGSSKRQRLVDGKYKKSSSLTCSESPADSVNELILTNRERKVKVREAVKILESIIPGSNSKDPLSLIDDAIVYLKAMKTEAEALESSTC